jgi:ABC-type nitrate/sulfonate/bicarbonate transport system substrate-binding protein
MRTIVISLVLLAALSGCNGVSSQNAGPLHKVVLAYTTQPDSALVHIAVAKGFFAQEGIDVQPQMHSFGKSALRSVLEGKADLATAAETPIMFAALNGEKPVIVAGIFSTSSNSAIIGRKDRGIMLPRDLKGKRVAYTAGTTGEFFLESFLTANGLTRKDLVLSTLKPDDMFTALTQGKVDATCTWNFPLVLLRKELGANGTVFFDPQIYTQTFNLVARPEWVKKNPEITKGVLRALIKAEGFVEEHPDEALGIVAQVLKVDKALLRSIWSGFTYRVQLDKRLLITLEDETRWAMKNGLTARQDMPDYTGFIYLDALLAIKPDEVTLSR